MSHGDTFAMVRAIGLLFVGLEVDRMSIIDNRGGDGAVIFYLEREGVMQSFSYYPNGSVNTNETKENTVTQEPRKQGPAKVFQFPGPFKRPLDEDNKNDDGEEKSGKDTPSETSSDECPDE